MARLVVLQDGRTTTHEFEGGARIGRAPDNDVVLPGEGVSRYHALVEATAAGYVVRDLDSKNGTRLNDIPVEGEMRLADGDVIALPGAGITFLSGAVTVTIVTPVRTGGEPVSTVVTIDANRAEVRIRGEVVFFPPKEFRTLELLLSRRGTVVAKDEIARHVWPEYEGNVSDYNIHQVISRVRRAIEVDPAHPELLVTRPGFGYVLV